MKKTSKGKSLDNVINPAALYILGALYPYVTGGMEIFNYYFLNYRLAFGKETIFYVGENKTDHDNGHFILLKRWWPARIFYPVQFFFLVSRLRTRPDYAYLSYAEQSWILVYAQSLTLRFFKIPYFITIHWGKEPDWKFRFPFVSFFTHARAVIGVSEPICASFRKAVPGQQFQYIPPLIPFCRSAATKLELKKQLGYENREKILLFVGSLKAMKNPETIVEAFRAIGPDFLEDQQIRLIIAGTGDLENTLKEKVAYYQLGKYIRMTGWISRENMPAYYKAADCYIISSDYEGTSLSLLEAMFNKLTIIASDAPGINSMLTHERNALLYETNNTLQLAETIKRAFTDGFLAERLAKDALYDFEAKYSYELMMKKYNAVFQTLYY